MSGLAPFRRNALTSLSFEQCPQLVCMLCKCRFKSFFLRDIWCCVLRLRVTPLFLRGWFSGFLNSDFHLMIVVFVPAAAAMKANTSSPDVVSMSALQTCLARTSGKEIPRVWSLFPVLWCWASPRKQSVTLAKGLFEVDAIRHRCPASFPEKECFTPREHPVVVVVFRHNSHIPSCLKSAH